MLSSQLTGDRSLFVSVCVVSGVPSLCLAHTSTSLQPAAHLASMEYPPNISLYSLSTHHGSRLDFFFSFSPLACASTFKSENSQPAAVAVTCVCRDVIQLLSFPQKSSAKHFCCDIYADSVHLCDPDSFVSGPRIVHFKK